MPARVSRVLLVASVGVLALSLEDSFFNWVLYTENFMRRVLFGG
jgi:hypothetical protein